MGDGVGFSLMKFSYASLYDSSVYSALFVFSRRKYDARILFMRLWSAVEVMALVGIIIVSWVSLLWLLLPGVLSECEFEGKLALVSVIESLS